MALASKGLEGDLDLSRNLIEQMYACFDCMACNDICPVGIRPADLAVEMRHVQEQRNPAAWKNTLFGGLIAKASDGWNWQLFLYEFIKNGIRKLVMH